MTDHFLSLLPAGVLIVCTLFLLFSILVEPKCPKCKSVMKRGGYYDEKLFCSNPKCKRYGVESYE